MEAIRGDPAPTSILVLEACGCSVLRAVLGFPLRLLTIFFRECLVLCLGGVVNFTCS